MGIGIILIVLGVFFLFTGFLDEPTIFLIVLGIILPVLGVFVVIGSNKAIEQEEDFRKRLLETLKLKFDEENLNITQDVISTDNLVCGIDEENEKVCFFNYVENVRFEGSVYSYKDILEVELIIDGETITKTSRSSQIGGVLLGSVIAGGVGAIIGGLSGKTSSKEKIAKIQLKIIVNETKNPYKIITFLDMPEAIDKNDQSVKLTNELITHWHSLFKVLIEKADKEDKNKNVIQNYNTSTTDTADEIRKLHDLFKEGIINQVEFDIQKKKIIS